MLPSLFADLGNLVVMAQEDEPFIGSTMFFVLGGVLVAGLVGLLFFLRSRRTDDD